EYIIKPDKSIIDQRELEQDTDSFMSALRSIFREDVNIVMLGQLRDQETMAAAISAAETGHLVFASIHTNSASQTIERIIESFPPDEQEQIRGQLSNTIAGVISQRLVPRIKGGLIPAVEVMVATTAIRTQIRDNRLKQLDLVIDTSYDMGMISLERSLAELVRKQEITLEKAEFYSLNPANLHSLLK
ncbi:MAG: type IV pilus twitching motility protein PilT, partial [Candidatus Yanofskybacteria bacterium]|nr:type IV pilus twitching motility protein PilT [Candidatus Yanofskybacteria bacterium]